MSNKTTVLRSQRHREFLAAQREDPITRKVFAAGDRIALCATCLLPFMGESWNAMGGTHCGQSATTGLEAFETEAEAETPAAPDGTNSGITNTDNGSAGQSAAATTATALELMPIPIELHEVPIKLR